MGAIIIERSSIELLSPVPERLTVVYFTSVILSMLTNLVMAFITLDFCTVYIYLIARVRVQYGEIFHEHAQVFSRAEGE